MTNGHVVWSVTDDHVLLGCTIAGMWIKHANKDRPPGLTHTSAILEVLPGAVHLHTHNGCRVTQCTEKKSQSLNSCQFVPRDIVIKTRRSSHTHKRLQSKGHVKTGLPLNTYCLLSCREHSPLILFAFADPLWPCIKVEVIETSMSIHGIHKSIV